MRMMSLERVTVSVYFLRFATARINQVLSSNLRVRMDFLSSCRVNTPVNSIIDGVIRARTNAAG